MINKRIGKRIKERREQLGLTQEQFADKMGVTTNYISTLERGASFPRCEKLILLLNTLECSADFIFQDVLDYGDEIRASVLSQRLERLPPEDRRLVMTILESVIHYKEEVSSGEAGHTVCG